MKSSGLLAALLGSLLVPVLAIVLPALALVGLLLLRMGGFEMGQSLLILIGLPVGLGFALFLRFLSNSDSPSLPHQKLEASRRDDQQLEAQRLKIREKLRRNHELDQFEDDRAVFADS